MISTQEGAKVKSKLPGQLLCRPRPKSLCVVARSRIDGGFRSAIQVVTRRVGVANIYDEESIFDRWAPIESECPCRYRTKLVKVELSRVKDHGRDRNIDSLSTADLGCEDTLAAIPHVTTMWLGLGPTSVRTVNQIPASR